jgi:hypothetical protein
MTAQLPATPPNPPRWIDAVLCLVLARHNRDAVMGDLLEEYRQVILPARGRFPAALWYFRQISPVDHRDRCRRRERCGRRSSRQVEVE